MTGVRAPGGGWDWGWELPMATALNRTLPLFSEQETGRWGGDGGKGEAAGKAAITHPRQTRIISLSRHLYARR